MQRRGWMFPLVMATLGWATEADAQHRGLATTTAVGVGITSVGYGGLAVSGIALADGSFGTAAGAASVGALPFLVGPPLTAFSSGARARKLGVTPRWSNLALVSLGTGLTVATTALATPNRVRLQQVTLISGGVLWTTGTGLAIAQSATNRRATKGDAPTARVRLGCSPWVDRERRGFAVVGSF